jgi:penicillin-binding protein 1A
VAEQARQMIFGQYGEETYSRGLNVYLTIRAEEQMSAYRALRRGIMDYERRQVYRGPEAYVDLPADPADLDTRVAEALSDHGQQRATPHVEAQDRRRRPALGMA